jgi:hypothetical protein
MNDENDLDFDNHRLLPVVANNAPFAITIRGSKDYKPHVS